MASKGSRGQPSRAGGEDRKCLQLVEGMGRVLGPQDVGPALSVPPTTCKTSEQTAGHSAPWRSQHEPRLQGETGSSAGARGDSPRLGQATLLPEEACQGSPGPLPCLSQPALPCVDFPPVEARPAQQEPRAGVRTSDSSGASAACQRRLLRPRAPSTHFGSCGSEPPSQDCILAPTSPRLGREAPLYPQTCGMREQPMGRQWGTGLGQISRLP